MNEIKERIFYLRDLIKKWSHHYYVLNEPIVSDAIFDQHFQELQELETEYPELLVDDSPTQVVQGTASNVLGKVKHFVPMLSLKTETDYTEKATGDFMKKMKDLLGAEEVSIITELKYDGLGLDIRYVNGKLQWMATRGDGDVGEDVTHNLCKIDFIAPELKSPCPAACYVRGEVMVTKAKFKELNDDLISRGQKPYVNPRNAAAGILRRKVPEAIDRKDLIFMAYQFINEDEYEIVARSQSQMLSYLGNFGFHSGIHSVVKTAAELWRFHEMADKWRASMEYEIDGVVYKVDNFYQQKKLGFISREPRWAVAHKFPPQEAVTTLEAIDVQVGRTGAITPVARITPTYVGGTTNTNVTLHNVFDLRKRGVRLGDKVVIRRAGDVIPELVKYSEYVRPGYVPNFKMPCSCPVCGHPVIRGKGDVKYYCTGGTHCDGQRKAIFEQFVSRNAMRIDGFGEKLISALVDSKRLKNLSDIYSLTEQDLRQVEGFEDKKVRNVLSAIEKSKTVKFEKLLYALGIRHVGQSTASSIAARYADFDALRIGLLNDKLSINDVGEVTEESIRNYFRDDDNNAVIAELMELGVTIEKEEPKGTTLTGKSFAITGSFGGTSRDHIRSLIINNGGKFVGGVSKTTSYLIAGEGGGEKRKLAESPEFNVPVISFADFINLIK